MPDKHPIAPPPELVKRWRELAPRCRDGGIAREDWLMAMAAQYGADQELDACCAWLLEEPLCASITHKKLRAARRKPPSLKEQALAILEDAHRGDLGDNEMAILRRALEQLDD